MSVSGCDLHGRGGVAIPVIHALSHEGLPLPMAQKDWPLDPRKTLPWPSPHGAELGHLQIYQDSTF